MNTVFDFDIMEIVDMKPLPSNIELSASEYSDTVEALTPKDSNEINLADLWCNQKSILIVDDEKNILSTLSRALRVEDYKVDVAGNAEIAWEKISSQSFDCF